MRQFPFICSFIIPDHPTACAGGRTKPAMTEASYRERGERKDYPTLTGEFPSFTKMLAVMGLYVIVGSFMVAYLWESLNQLFTLQIDLTRLMVAVPMLMALIGVLVLLAQTLRGWTDLHHIE